MIFHVTAERVGFAQTNEGQQDRPGSRKKNGTLPGVSEAREEHEPLERKSSELPMSRQGTVA